MDRKTRKANLKKLQIPGTSGNKQRKTDQTDNSTGATSAITKYFPTPRKQNKNIQEQTNIINTDTNIKIPSPPEANASSATRSRAKRTKLDAFIFKDPSNVPSSVKKSKKSLNDEDLIVPESKIKKAPKPSQTKAKRAKPSRAKKQSVIKTAFLRNEQLFAEIAAQHCAADQFDGDDVQMALAISQSEAENKGITIADSNVKDIENDAGIMGNEVDAIREKLKKYGFRTAEKKDYNTFAAAFLPKRNNRKLNSKWANKFTALTLRSAEIQLKKLQANIERLLNSQCSTATLLEQEQVLPLYELQSSVLKRLGVHEGKRILNNAAYTNRPNELYFVKELFEINQVPAGHLLKDWSAIQGRDLTPNPKDKQNIEKVEKLRNLYQDLEEYFSSRKRLDWTLPSTDFKDDHDLVPSKDLANEKTQLSSTGNEELNGMIDLIENIQSKDECANENSATNTFTTISTYDKKILQLLPTAKSLDNMNVSSCSINTQATINTTQKNRSNSPDLFADSDVELEETNNSKEKMATNVQETRTRESSSDDLKTIITTYEIFSSDEVKKTSFMELNKSNDKVSIQKHSLENQEIADVIDLTQEDLPVNNKTIESLNQSKPIVEIDLFAESPIQDENSDTADINSSHPQTKTSQTDKKHDFKFTLSSEASHQEPHILDNKESFKLTTTEREEDHDVIVSNEIVMNQTNLSFTNCEGNKQLENSNFYKNPANFENDIAKYNLTGNDTIFEKLCNKYLNDETNNNSKAEGLQRIESGKRSLRILKTPAQCDNFDNTQKRKSLSFTAKTPSKLDVASISKSQSYNNLNLNISIDLTQNDDDKSRAVEEDDDCLVLSDDEINYSIWQADKTLLNLKTSAQNTPERNNISLSSSMSSSDSEYDYKVFHKENIIELPFNKENEKEFSYLDLEEKEKSFIKITVGPEDALSDFEILASKYASANSDSQKEMRFDRSEFGILEEYSGHNVDYTPNLCTPTKVLAEASFLSSPTETAAPMKRYSRCHKTSNNKFQALLHDVPEKSPPRDIPEFEDFDDFDMLLSTSALKTTISPKKPQGIDQLLKAEINFMENQWTPPAATENFPSETQEVKYNNRTYTVRYTTSPKPNYTTYSETELLKQLYNYGIKPLKRKQAVKMLEYIYNQTHPILMEDPAEDVIDMDDKCDKEEEDALILDDFEFPSTSKAAQKSNRSDEMNFKMFSSASEKEVAAAKPAETASKTLDLQDSCGFEMLRYSSDLKAELLQDEIYILPTNVTKKTPQPLLPFHIAWYNLVCSNTKLHETILMYEPVDLQEIYLFLKSLGYRYDPKHLKTFFDRRCIIFRYDLAGAAGGNKKTKNSNRHIRKSKKSKAAMMKN